MINKKEYHVTLFPRIRRAIAKTAVRWVFKALGRIQITGLENIPRGKPYVAAINHVSIYDPPLVLSMWPEIMEAVGAVDVFDKPFQGDLLRAYGVIPVHRGEYDRVLIDTMLAILRSGYPLMIAPEGTRSHGGGLRRAKPGVGYILDEAAVPLLPVGLVAQPIALRNMPFVSSVPCLRCALASPSTCLRLRVAAPPAASLVSRTPTSSCSISRVCSLSHIAAPTPIPLSSRHNASRFDGALDAAPRLLIRVIHSFQTCFGHRAA